MVHIDHFYYMLPNNVIDKIDFFVGYRVDFVEMCTGDKDDWNPIGGFRLTSSSLCWCTGKKEKSVFWEFDSITMRNMSHRLLLFCATCPSYHVIKNHLVPSLVKYFQAFTVPSAEYVNWNPPKFRESSDTNLTNITLLEERRVNGRSVPQNFPKDGSLPEDPSCAST